MSLYKGLAIQSMGTPFLHVWPVCQGFRNTPVYPQKGNVKRHSPGWGSGTGKRILGPGLNGDKIKENLRCVVCSLFLSYSPTYPLEAMDLEAHLCFDSILMDLIVGRG